MKAIFYSKIKRYHKSITIILGCFVFLIAYKVVHAQGIDIAYQNAGTSPGATGGLSLAIGSVLSWILSYVNYVIGTILIFLLDILVKFAQYNDFINAEPIKQGWVILRDLCNMFFILVLLVIAFATILRIESYPWKKLLPKLLLMAVLINFSKTICGLIIDFAQVIMLTFVAGFAQNGANNFVNMFSVDKYLSIATTRTTASSTPTGVNDLGYQIILGSVAGTIALVITLIVTVVLLLTLVMRNVMLWIYIILSPLAYLMSAFPQGQRYATQWWSEFSKQVITGPVLAFFLWLALATTASTKLVTDLGAGGEVLNGVNGGTKLFTSGPFQQYIITIGLLVGGLIITQQIGGMAGSLAGKGLGWAKKMGSTTLKVPKRALRGAADLGIGTVARSNRVRNALATVGSTQNALATITGVRALATSAYSGLGKRRRDQEEEAKKYVGQFNDPRFLRRFANTRYQLTPWAQEVRSAARDKAPSTIIPAAGRQGHLSGMDKDKLGKLSDAEWYSLGHDRTPITGKALTYLQRNHDERGAYNFALLNNGAHPDELIVGTNNEGREIDSANRFGNIPGIVAQANPAGGFAAIPNPLRVDPNREDRLIRRGEFANRYRLAESDQTVQRGAGNVSVNSFARGQGNVMAVDFDKLGIEDLRKGLPDTEFSKIKGVNLNDSGTIKQVADKMVGILEQEISKLQSGGTSADDPRLKNLFEARARFTDPSNLKSLNLVNSSAQGYKTRDVIKTVVHERLHDTGIQDEVETERRTEQILGEKSYSSLGGSAPKEQPEKLVEKENISEQENAEAVKTAASDPATAPTMKGIVGFGAMQFPPIFREIVYQLMRLNKTMIGQEGALGRVSKGLAGLTGLVNQDSTPLEVSVIAKKIQNNLDKTNV